MRIGINVPNELIKQVKAIDPDVNVSQICREALKDYVATAGSVTERVASDGMSEQISRLEHSKQRPVIEPDWVGYALEDARDWVRAIEPDDWYDFWEIFDEYKEKGSNLRYIVGYLHPKGVNFFEARTVENEEWCRQRSRRGVSGDALDKARDEYNRAWLAYVNEVRQKQLQYFEDERQRVMDELEKGRRAFREPEVPPQLLN